jgi:DNA invertase Pin-like site-specific DNA recombinase
MLTDQIDFVRTASVRALTSLAQIKEGKVQIYDLDKLNTIIMLLYDIEEQTRLNTIQLISMVAEYPPAREKFKQALEKLNEMARQTTDKPLIATHAQVAIDVITWVP